MTDRLTGQTSPHMNSVLRRLNVKRYCSDTIRIGTKQGVMATLAQNLLNSLRQFVKCYFFCDNPFLIMPTDIFIFFFQQIGKLWTLQASEFLSFLLFCKYVPHAVTAVCICPSSRLGCVAVLGLRCSFFQQSFS